MKSNQNKRKPKHLTAYKERARIQCWEWVEGRPQHNVIDNECCPDFSCCRPNMFTFDKEARLAQYHKAYGRQN